MKKPTGLLFGSFNPIHIGHIAIAGYMKEFAGMDEIWFIVSPQNPFKKRNRLASPAARLQMVKLAIARHDSFIASDIEFGMPLPSYTINTMEKLAAGFPEREFHIITGTDNLDSIRKWKGGDKLVSGHKFLVYPRTGSDASGIGDFGNARMVKAPVIDISSSFIRRALRQGRNMRAFVPDAAYDYLVRNRLYE